MMINTCPICGYEGEFDQICQADAWHPAIEYGCPMCHSQGRHRMIYLLYQRMKDKYNLHGALLHCSPCASLKATFEKDFNYTSIDFPPRESYTVAMAALNQDLRNTYFKDNWFDVIVCSAVLDQIKEVDVAIAELYRITKPGGIIITEVPIMEKEASTLLPITSWDKWWRCGLDWFDKYEEVGFCNLIFKNDQMRDYEKYGLTEDYIVVSQKPIEKGEVENDKQ